MSTAAQSPDPQHPTTALSSHKVTKPPRSDFPAPCLGGLNPVRGVGESHLRVHSRAVPPSAAPNHRAYLSPSHQATKVRFSGSVSWWLESRPRDGRGSPTCSQLRSLPIHSTEPPRLPLTKSPSHQGPVFWAPCLGGLNPVCGMGERHPRVHSIAVSRSTAPNHRAYLSQSHQATKVRFSVLRVLVA